MSVGVILAITKGRSNAVNAADVQFADQPFLFDVNGDGIADVLGRSRTPSGAWIAAYDGRDGKELWRTEPLTADANDAGAVRGVAGDKFVSVDGLGKAQAFHAKTGQPAWSGLVGEVASDMCEGNGFVRIRARDGVELDFSLATGQKLKGEGACRGVATSNAPMSGGYRLVDWSAFPKLGLPKLNEIEGFANHRALVSDDNELAFMLGSTKTGSPVAMVAAVKGKNVVWKSVVPAVDPLTTDVNVTTQVAAYAKGRLVVPYNLKGTKGTRLAAFDAQSGTRLWDVPIHDGSQVSNGIAMDDHNVYFATWTAVYVFKADTGELRWKFGQNL